VVLGASVAWAWPALHQPAVSAAGSSAQQPTGHGASGTDWQPWSHEAVNSALAEGRPVFVDFTAAWCVTCQFNKRTTLADASVIADLQAKRVVLLRADWTRRDEAISAELARLGRNGVPVYALYTPGGNSEPQLLSEILSVAEVRTAMARW
jgi:thiol:disulfide interchange protein